ncbi:hypothetical protein TNIN_309181 [Trichonephila inaurata madagascariensis]|uniref:Uncharacterized protein n=1 Tax=Trichonephila inaurata madagascariensis TaxID=2747483 RepID=A0A8X6XXD7_9ARAC|nr:hypothetical protein TNIN_309181 [Trichonephila inaurata madagascariensis]
MCVRDRWAFFISRSKTSASGSFTCSDSEMDIDSNTSPQRMDLKKEVIGHSVWNLECRPPPFTDYHTYSEEALNVSKEAVPLTSHPWTPSGQSGSPSLDNFRHHEKLPGRDRVQSLGTGHISSGQLSLSLIS